MSRTVAVRCVAPERRDALEEVARLALTFVTLSLGPEAPDFHCVGGLEVHISPSALIEGCHLPDTAQELLEAVQAFGVKIKKTCADTKVAAPEWQDWWSKLEVLDPNQEYDLELEIL